MTAVAFVDATPLPVELGRIQQAGGGAVAFRTDRLGNRWAFKLLSKPMRVEPDGRRWGSRFRRAKRLGGIFRVQIPGFDVGAPGFGVTVAADTAAGRAIPIQGATPGYVIREGQFLSVIAGGQRYLDCCTAQTIVASDGTATVPIECLIRVPLSEDDVVELAEPKIEGSVLMEGEPGWGADRMTQFAFTVREDR